jgi:putative membrane protein
MKRLLSAAIVVSLLGACHFHSRSWLANHASDPTPTPTAVVPDTQPVVRQEGAPVPEESKKKKSSWRPDRDARATAMRPMGRSSMAASDGRTVGMFLMANDVNLSFAKVAYSAAESDDVKSFARRMLTDHTQIVATIRSLIADQNVSPSDDSAGEDLRDLSTLQRDSLRALTRRAFDSAYVAMELDRHRAMLSMIDDVLLPRARSAEIREMLAATRPIIAAHVAHAEQLQASLAKR